MTSLPRPVRWYREARPKPLPEELDRWRFLLCEPPYLEFESIPRVEQLAGRLSTILEPPSGAILLALPVDVDPSMQFAEIDWLRSTFPWLSLVVETSNADGAVALASMLTHLARRGAIVMPSRSGALREIAAVVLAAASPLLDAPLWLETALPGWRVAARDHAARSLIEGFTDRMEPGRDSVPGLLIRSRAPIWRQVGRALSAALLTQTHQGWPDVRVARRAKYYDAKSMNRSLLRWFGIDTRGVRGTAGLEWLMWRFICGLGTGRMKAWDRNL